MMEMETSKIEDLLLKLIEDVAYIKSKLEAIEDQQLGSRIDALEAENREHDRIIKSLERRANTMEEFTRSGITESKKQMTSVWISMGLAIFSVVLNVVINLF
jgi:hypothetical protein